MDYEVTIGIEIHLELLTKTKMFSDAGYNFQAQANTNVNEIDLALPGTLPSINQEAIRKAVMVCLAHNLKIDTLLRFDRKNYFYSDLPKGYQITQQFHPLGKNGYLTINCEGQEKKIRINRIHLEEDTAKQYHLNDETLIDFNRASAPLIEIVSEPDMHSGLEASLYVEKLRQNLLYLGVSDCKMEEGSMRCDVNISLRKKGSSVFGNKVEIKNLNSINNVRQAIEYEIKRQSKLLNNNEEVIQSTRRFDEKTQKTVLMRKKEGSVDYKFFCEPNIFPIRLSSDFLADIEANLPPLPDQYLQSYRNQYQLSDYDVHLLLNNYELNQYFRAVMVYSKYPKTVCNILNSELLGLMAKHNLDFNSLKLTPENFSKLVDLLEGATISSKQAKEVLALMLDNKDPLVIVQEKGFKQVSDQATLLAYVNEVLSEQAQSVIDYHNGKDRALGFLVGQLMKKSKGQANPALATALLKEALDAKKM